MESQNVVDKYRQVSESVSKNLHMLNVCNPGEVNILSLVKFNNRLIISECKTFLEAVKEDIGGEIMEDAQIGPFLYYGEID